MAVTLVSMHGDAVATVLDHGEIDLGVGERPRLIDKPQAARLLGGISVKEVERRIGAGDLEVVNLGRRVLVVLESLDAYVLQLRAQKAP